MQKALARLNFHPMARSTWSDDRCPRQHLLGGKLPGSILLASRGAATYRSCEMHDQRHARADCEAVFAVASCGMPSKRLAA
jgi:hypothetical protein